MRPTEGRQQAPVVDLANCDQEPIHVPGSIQPHGVLLVLDGPGRAVVQASENVADLLGTPAEAVLGRDALSLVDAPGRGALDAALALDDPREAVAVRVTAGGRRFDAQAHRYDGRLILELELADDGPPAGADLDRLVRFMVGRMQGELRLDDFCRAAAREVRALTGFDRVMVYRFDEEHNGAVIAEEKAEGLEPFLGLCYPASDIPAQARRLYALNWVRHIPDVGYAASRLVPAEAGRPTDLSFAVLRSVSPIHVEYLRNMGVAASLSISVLKGGRLWGLIACHHYSPRHVNARQRAACESVGVLMSLQLSARSDVEEERRRAEASARCARLASALAGGPDCAAALCSLPDDLLGLVGASGAAVVSGGMGRLVGAAPPEADVMRLAGWVRGALKDHLYATDRLGDQAPPGAAGLLAMEVSPDQGDLVLWFRPEQERTVHWAGDPHHKQVVPGPLGPRLSPRGSFALWREEQKGRSLPWSAIEREAALSLRNTALAALARRARQLQEESLRKDEFLATLAHELRGPLAPIRTAVEVMRLRDSPDPTILQMRDLIGRQAEALTHLVDDLLDVSRVTRGKVLLRKERVALASVVARAVETSQPIIDAGQHRLEVSLPAAPLELEADPARLAQVVANLLTNAAKYTPPGGLIRLTALAEGGWAVLRVRDSGVGIAQDMLERVFDLFSQAEGARGRSQGGLGIGLSLVRALVGLHGGSVRAASEGEGKGSEFTVRLPLAVPAQRRRRVLVVEDSRDAADSLAMLLRMLGHEARPAWEVKQALEAADELRPDVVLVVVGASRLDGHEVRRLIAQRPWAGETVFLALAGRTQPRQAGFQQQLARPVDMDELARALKALSRGE